MNTVSRNISVGHSFQISASARTTQRTRKSKTQLPNRTAGKPGSSRVKAPYVQKKTSFDISVPRRLSDAKDKGMLKIPVELGFTRSNERFVGRVAMLGFASALLGELLTGLGPLAQFGIETGGGLDFAKAVVVVIVSFNLAAALSPAKGSFAPGEKLTPERIVNNFFPQNGFGFTAENEIFVGRVAQLGFASALIGELVTGKGALAQFGLETGITLSEAEPFLLLAIGAVFFAAVSPAKDIEE